MARPSRRPLNEWGKALVELCQEAGIAQSTLASAIGKQPAYLSQLSHRTELPTDKAVRLTTEEAGRVLKEQYGRADAPDRLWHAVFTEWQLPASEVLTGVNADTADRAGPGHGLPATLTLDSIALLPFATSPQEARATLSLLVRQFGRDARTSANYWINYGRVQREAGRVAAEQSPELARAVAGDLEDLVDVEAVSDKGRRQWLEQDVSFAYLIAERSIAGASGQPLDPDVLRTFKSLVSLDASSPIEPWAAMEAVWYSTEVAKAALLTRPISWSDFQHASANAIERAGHLHLFGFGVQVSSAMLAMAHETRSRGALVAGSRNVDEAFTALDEAKKHAARSAMPTIAFQVNVTDFTALCSSGASGMYRRSRLEELLWNSPSDHQTAKVLRVADTHGLVLNEATDRSN